MTSTLGGRPGPGSGTRLTGADDAAGVRWADEGGRPPEPHPVLARLDSPLSTYYLLLGAAGALLTIGLVMVLSASSVTSFQQKGDSFAIFLAQARFAALGLFGAFVASRIPVLTWRRLSLLAVLAALVLQILVFTPLGWSFQGNRNWIRLGSATFQPSELGKLALVLFGAHILTTKRRLLHDWRHTLIPLILPVGVALVGLVLLGGDLGTTLVLLGVLAAMLWTSGISARLFGVALLAASVLAGVMVLVRRSRMERIDSWLNCTEVAQCWQTSHSQFALADGGLGGLGLGASREKWGWLPERHNDFIFAIIGEELGIGGTLTILVLICLIAFACHRIIMQSDDLFIRIATAGVMGWFVVQSVVNIGAVVGLLPVIGVPLPLVSDGGSALVTMLFALGMLASFARNEPACRRALAQRPRVLRRSLSVMSPIRRRR